MEADDNFTTTLDLNQIFGEDDFTMEQLDEDTIPDSILNEIIIAESINSQANLNETVV